MKKVVVMLFISFLVGMVNASTMPVAFGGFSHNLQTAMHGHCEGVVSPVSHDESRPDEKFGVSHSCCPTLAVFNNAVSVALTEEPTFYLLSEISKLISNIAESIYKPPKSYL